MPAPAQPGLAPTQGRAGSPNYRSLLRLPWLPPRQLYLQRRGMDTSPGISCPILIPAQSWAPPNPRPSLLLTLPDVLGDTPRPGGSDAARMSLSLPLPAACPKGCVPEGMPVWMDVCPDGHEPQPQPRG